jgi:amidohydrolase
MREENYRLAVELRHQLHAHPELSGQERETKRRLMEFLRTHTGLELVDRGAWFYAVYRAGRGTPIAFRADFDALPIQEDNSLTYHSQTHGVSHKCGHDGHSAALAALALEIDAMGAERDVYFIFQHAEEVGGGGAMCAELLREMQVGEVYAFHSISGYPAGAVCLRPGTMNCASKGLIFRLEGIPAHASTPELGRNPALAIAHMVDGLSVLTDPEKYRGLVMCTVVQIAVGEPAFGISAHRGELLLTLRAEHDEELEALEQALRQLAAREAVRYGLKYSVSCQDVFPGTVNNPAAVDKVERAAAALGMPVVRMEQPMRASEDFGYYLRQTPGALFLLGNGEEYPPLHSVQFDFLDRQIAAACDLFFELARKKL